MPSRSIEVTSNSPAPEGGHLLRERNGVDAGRIAPAMGEDLPAVALARPDTFLASMATTMHWSPNFSAASRTKRGFFTAAVLIETLSAPASSSRRMSSTRTHPAADGEGHEAGLGGPLHHVEEDAAVLVARGDVEEAELVGAGRVIGLGGFDRVAGVPQVDEPHALHDAPVLHVEARDEADLQHQHRLPASGR